MWFAFAAFVLAALAVLVMRVEDRAGLAGTELVEASPWHSARAGLGALLRDRPVRDQVPRPAEREAGTAS